MPSGGGGSGGTQTVTQRNDPWDAQKPYLQTGFQRAQQWLDSNQPNLYPGSRVTAFTPLQERTQRDIVARADAGSNILRAGQNAVQDISTNGIQDLARTIDGTYLNKDPSRQNLGRMAGGDFTGTGHGNTLNTAATGGFNNLAGGNTLSAAAQGAYLNANPANALQMQTAMGGFLGSNPYTDAQFNRAARGLTRNFAEGVMPGVDSAFSRGGRFASGLHANAADAATEQFGRSLADLGTGIYGGAYGQERGLMQNAAQNIGTNFANERALQQGAASGLLGSQLGTAQQMVADQLAGNQQVQSAYDAERNRMNQAAIADAQARMQAAGMAPTMAMADYNDLAQKMNIGDIRQGQEQARLADDLARWDFMQNKDVNKLGQYMGLIGGGYGSTQTTQQPIYNNRASGILGGGIGGYTLGNALVPGIGGPVGAGIGGILSMFG